MTKYTELPQMTADKEMVKRLAKQEIDPGYCHCGCGQPLPRPKYPSAQTRFIFNHHTRRPLVERFWAKVNKDGPISPSAPLLGPCWIWIGGRVRRGYGNLGDGGRMVLAHRFSYELHRGELLPTDHVLHHCDNPPCVNPDHLYAGTEKDNAEDRKRRGRGKSISPRLRGEAHGRAKLTEIQVGEIRIAVAAGIPKLTLAAQYGVSRTLIRLIAQRKSWRHIP